MAKKTQELTSQDILTAVPVLNEKVVLDKRDSGCAMAMIPLKKPEWLSGPLGWFLPYSSHRRVQLDVLGMAVLNLCDGKRSVEDVIEEFARQNLLSWRESQVCVMQFLRQIAERGVVAIVGLSPNRKSE